MDEDAESFIEDDELGLSTARPYHCTFCQLQFHQIRATQRISCTSCGAESHRKCLPKKGKNINFYFLIYFSLGKCSFCTLLGGLPARGRPQYLCNLCDAVQPPPLKRRRPAESTETLEPLQPKRGRGRPPKSKATTSSQVETSPSGSRASSSQVETRPSGSQASSSLAGPRPSGFQASSTLAGPSKRGRPTRVVSQAPPSAAGPSNRRAHLHFSHLVNCNRLLFFLTILF